MPGIEVLRGIAASAVVVEHVFALTTEPHFRGYRIVEGLGEWGVALFFLISGYILSDYFWQPRDRWSARTFLVRRYFRIAPAYYVNVGVLFLFFAPYSEVFSHQGLKQVAANLTFSHWMFPNTASSLNVNGALWTLTIEMTLYLALPIMAPPMRNHPWLTSGLLFTIGMAFRVYVTTGTALIHQYFGPHAGGSDNARIFLIRQFPGVLPLFTIGMLVRFLHLRWDSSHDRNRRQTSVWVLLALLVPSLLALHWVETGLSPAHRWLFVVYEPLLVVALVPAVVYAGRVSPFRSGLASRELLWLGERSYSLYLWHFPIILAVFGRGAEINPPHMSYVGLRVLLVAVGSVAVASLSYNAIERPARLFGRRLANKWIRTSSDTRDADSGQLKAATTANS